jgi:hypothetical protein
VLHSTLKSRIAEENSRIAPAGMKKKLQEYLSLVSGHAMATSELKARSWSLTDDVVGFGVDTNDYLPYSGKKACGLRVQLH